MTENTEASEERERTVSKLLLVPLDDIVVFPNMNVTLTIDVGDEERVLLVPKHEGEYAKVGTVAEVTETVRLPGGGTAVALNGLHRAIAGAAESDSRGRLFVEADERPDEQPTGDAVSALETEYRAVVEEILELRGDDGRIAAFVRSISDAGALADTSGYSPDLTFEQKVQVLEAVDVAERLELSLAFQRERLALMQIRRRIREDVNTGMESQQREYILRKQLESIKKELGEDETSVVEEFRAKIAESAMPDHVREQAERELARFERMGESSPEAQTIRSYMDWLLAVPWGVRSEERLDPKAIRDEAEIRGHRRTYIGALPGRLVRALRDAKTMNPVILLDEVDKVGADWRGDPSAALLEVLDPAQNSTFRDHYLDVELDLSDVIFIATANQADTIPGPLLDRMEVIRFDGYTTDEKVSIAKGYLWPRQRERNGLREDEVTVTDVVLETVISEYTREAGVRQLERELGKVLRKTATNIASETVEAPVSVDIAVVRDALGRQRFFREAAERTAVPGVATGLAVTGVGGDVLFVEATSIAGGEKLVLTGQLGDVMKESAQIALSAVRARAGDYGLEDDLFENRSFHLHVPAGAIPKDGPSAGITMATALASLLTGRPVRHTVGMTGEVTLQGRVLPIGGLKQKVLAAHAAGLTDVILPERNRPDLDDVPADVREAMAFHPVMTLGEVLDLALEPARSTGDALAR